MIVISNFSKKFNSQFQSKHFQNDGRREKTRSSRRARSSRKMEKYHKDRNVRSSGKSEELVPE